jgi:tetratricopeptide (TPR) repeat protein
MRRLIVIFFFIFSVSSLTAQQLDKARMLFEQNQMKEAETLLARIQTSSKDYAGARYFLGRISFAKNDFEEAAEYFEEAIDANDKVADYYEWHGDALASIAQHANLFRQGILAPKMKSSWERSIELDPRKIEPRVSLIEYYMQAPGFMGGSEEKAEVMAREIMKLDAAKGHKALGSIYSKQDKSALAEAEFKKAAELNREYVSALGSFYITKKMFDKAFRLYDDELKNNPDDVDAKYMIGRISAVSGQRLDAGEAALREYLKHKPGKDQPSHAYANMRLAQILEKKGDKTMAHTHFVKAVQLDNSLKEANEGVERTAP